MIRWLKNIWFRLQSSEEPDARAGTGALGEQTAADFLRARHGFTIVARNWRSPRDRRDEIDLVCRDGKVLVFVEVKARAEGALVSGYQAVNERKRRALRRAIHAYLGALTPPPRTFRFDVAEVTLSDRLPVQVLHYENVPLFPEGYYLTRQTGSIDEVAK